MIRKFVILSFVFALSTCTLSYAASWDSFDGIDNSWDGQKAITNKEFEDTMNALEQNKHKQEAKQQRRLFRKFKGDSLHDECSAKKNSEIKADSVTEEGSEQLLNIPYDLYINGQKLDRGFYQAIAERNEKGIFVNLYQAYSLKSKIKVRETEDDFDQKELNFIKLVPYDNERMMLIYGCIDFNAYALINYTEPVYENERWIN